MCLRLSATDTFPTGSTNSDASRSASQTWWTSGNSGKLRGGQWRCYRSYCFYILNFSLLGQKKKIKNECVQQGIMFPSLPIEVAANEEPWLLQGHLTSQWALIIPFPSKDNSQMSVVFCLFTVKWVIHMQLAEMQWGLMLADSELKRKY